MLKIRTIFIAITVIIITGCKKQTEQISIPLPNAPTNLNVLVSANKITLDWTDNSTNEDGFKIERKSAGGVFSVLSTVGRDITTFLDNTTNPATTYTYRVYSFNAKGNSLAYSNEVTITAIALPVLSTTSLSALGNSSAVSGGTITSDAGSAITSKGVVWDVAINPTVNLATKTIDGSGNGSFSSNITGLAENTTYYVRAYATNAAGTAYGNELPFKTQGRPIVSTLSVTNTTINSANTGGNVTYDGGEPLTARGIVWNTSPNPTIFLSTKTNDGGGVGSFTSNISGLTGATTYYLRAYATNKYGTSYGNELSFKTQSTGLIGTKVADANFPIDIHFSNNNLYVLEDNDSKDRVRMWSPGATNGINVAGCTQDVCTRRFKGWGVFVDNRGIIYVASTSVSPGVQKWIAGSLEFSSVESYSSSILGDLFVDDNGVIYLMDRGNNRVVKKSPGGGWITVAGGNGQGSASNQLNSASGIFVDNSGNIYVADQANHRVQKWAPGATSGITVAGGNGAGSMANQLNNPTGIDIDAFGNIYVADQANHRVQKWAPGATSGITVAGGNGAGCNPDQLNSPRKVVITSNGTLFVSDTFCNRVLGF